MVLRRAVSTGLLPAANMEARRLPEDSTGKVRRQGSTASKDTVRRQVKVATAILLRAKVLLAATAVLLRLSMEAAHRDTSIIQRGRGILRHGYESGGGGCASTSA